MNHHLFCIAAFCCIALNAFAQKATDANPLTTTEALSAEKDAYSTNMLQGISIMDKAMTSAELDQAAAFFEQMTEEHPADWLPPYYAAYCYVTMAFIEKNAVQRDNHLNQAQDFLDIATKIDSRNAEIAAVQAYSYLVRTAIDPQVRMPEYGTLAILTLEDAQQLDPDNPRTYYLQAQNLFFAPELQGGGLNKACPIAQLAAKKYQLHPFQPNSIQPKWGAAMTDYMCQICAQMGK